MVTRLGLMPRSRRAAATRRATSASTASATGAPGAVERSGAWKSLRTGAQAVDAGDRLPDDSTIPVPPVASAVQDIGVDAGKRRHPSRTHLAPLCVKTPAGVRF